MRNQYVGQYVDDSNVSRPATGLSQFDNPVISLHVKHTANYFTQFLIILHNYAQVCTILHKSA
jgi:hypothetical protein